MLEQRPGAKEEEREEQVPRAAAAVVGVSPQHLLQPNLQDGEGKVPLHLPNPAHHLAVEEDGVMHHQAANQMVAVDGETSHQHHQVEMDGVKASLLLQVQLGEHPASPSGEQQLHPAKPQPCGEAIATAVLAAIVQQQATHQLVLEGDGIAVPKPLGPKPNDQLAVNHPPPTTYLVLLHRQQGEDFHTQNPPLNKRHKLPCEQRMQSSLRLSIR